MMNMLVSDSECETYTDTSDSEDHDDTESAYGGHAQSLLSSLDESIGKIDDFLAFERGFVHGDIVCSMKDPSGQLGRVVDVDLVVDLEASSGEMIKDVNSKKLLKVRPFASGDYVVCGPWLGRVDRVFDLVTILFDNGAKCEVMTGNPDILIPVSPSLFEDAPYLYYSGQRVRIKLPTFSKSARWLCGSWKASRDEGTVCHVEVGLVHVSWIASVIVGWDVIPSTPSHLQDPTNLTLLSCFPYVNWQLGDWCSLPSDYVYNLEMAAKERAIPNIAPQCPAKMQKKLGMKDHDNRQIYAIAKTKTKVDVLWQNGNRSFSLDSQTLFPVNNIGDHDFWPGQFVLEKVTSEDVHVPRRQRLGIVKNVDSQERTVKVKWMVPELKQTVDSIGGFSEEIVSAYELIEHPDFSHCMGDVVFRLLPHFEKLDENLLDIQTNGQSQRHEDLPVKSVVNSSLHLGKDTLEEKHIGEGPDEIDYLSCVGNVIGFKDEAIEVRWATGLISKVQPSEICGMDKHDDHASISALNEGAIQENSDKEIADQEELSRHGKEKEKVINDASEDCKEDMWDASALLYPRAAIGFLTNVVRSLFNYRGFTCLPGSAKSICLDGLNKSDIDFEAAASKEITDFGFQQWKGVPETQILKTEELQLDDNDLEPEILKQQVEEAKQNVELTFSPGGAKPGQFKQFDIVDDYSDHHFVNDIDKGLALSQVKRGWLKKVHQEWSILKKDLPDTIYVRVYEERMDLLRASITGAPGTPYHDGLFFFDIFFPPDYPREPPLVHFNSGGLRLNPNLYESGKVCLSLLKTWTGTGTEVWNPESSTVLQVLLSLQALVLNDKPYFNEAGYDKQVGRAEGERNSITYNENAFLLSLKSMLYVLHKPPKHFEALVEEHFTHRAHDILLACNAYMDGAQVGCSFGRGNKEGEGHKSNSTGFKIMLAKLFPKLVSGFTEKGIDCSQFLEQVHQVPNKGKNLT